MLRIYNLLLCNFIIDIQPKMRQGTSTTCPAVTNCFYYIVKDILWQNIQKYLLPDDHQT